MARELKREDRPGLYCVELRTENWDALVEWYRSVLGLRVLVRVLDEGYALLEAGETRIALLRRSASGGASGRISLAFEVNDVQIVCTRLQAAGVQFTQPRRDGEGLREITTSDPEGNAIRLFAWPDR